MVEVYHQGGGAMRYFILIIIVLLNGCSYGGVSYSRLDNETKKYYKELNEKVNTYCDCIKTCSAYSASAEWCSKYICNKYIERIQ